MDKRRVIPFFVVDRQASLEILKGFFAEHPKHKFGLLTHAFTSEEFKKKFREFPYSTKLKYIDTKNEELVNKIIEDNVTKFGDSGIFETNRVVPYEKLFDTYSYLKVNYGAIIDFYKDKNLTLESAGEAIKVYRKGGYTFRLVGVAQGSSFDEYLSCYEELVKMGYKYIAVGGILKRNGNSNYLRVSSNEFLARVLHTIREKFDPNWIFVFGAYNPKRTKILLENSVWGADYKGWLFEYEEDYSFAKDYLEQYHVPINRKKQILEVLEKYVNTKRRMRYLTSKKMKVDTELKFELRVLKKSLESLLSQENISLQELRFRRVREMLSSRVLGNDPVQ